MRYILIIILILFSIIVFSQKDSVIIEMKKLPPRKTFPIDNNKYLKVGDFSFYRTDIVENNSYNSMYLKEKDKFYFCILNDSLTIVQKFEIEISLFTSIIHFDSTRRIVLNAETSYLINKDSLLPKKIIVYSLSFIKNGNFIEYYNNGNIKVKGKYKINSKEGKWKYYSEEGKIIERKKFIKGKEKGVEAPLPLEE